MPKFGIDDFRPGDCVLNYGEMKVVLAKIYDKFLLSTDGAVMNIGLIKRVSAVNLDNDQVELGIRAYYQLRQAGMLSPKITALSVGDVVLRLNNNTAKIAIIAVIDRPRGFVFDRDGEILPWGRREMATTGWRTNQKDLLTEKGQVVMNQMYLSV